MRTISGLQLASGKVNNNNNNNKKKKNRAINEETNQTRSKS